MYQPKTGVKCGCKPGIVRDNCPRCEGTGDVIDFQKIRERSLKIEKCFYVPGSHSLIDFATPAGLSVICGENLEQIRSRYPGAELMDYAEVSREIDAAIHDTLKVGQPEKITEKQFYYSLEVLPPLHWAAFKKRGGGKTYQVFALSELMIANIAVWFVQIGDNFFRVYERITANKYDIIRLCE